MSDFKEFLRTVESGLYVVSVEPEHEQHKAWLSVYKISEVEAENEYFRRLYPGVTHIIRWVEISEALLKSHYDGKQEIDYENGTTHYLWKAHGESEAYAILEKYLTEQTVLTPYGLSDYPFR